MTKKNIRPPMELDLDAFLDSHTTTDEEEDDHHQLHSHRTVDEILLNDSDSSSSPSAPSSPSSFNRNYLRGHHDDVLVTSPKTLPLDDDASLDHFSETSGLSNLQVNNNNPVSNYSESLILSNANSQLINKPVEKKNSSRSAFDTSLGYSETLRLWNSQSINKPNESKLSSSSRSGDFSSESFSLPPLFGGVRSNAKPGAALAAAVAASRSITTPHAAAIKLRRATTGGLVQVVDTEELVSKSGGDSEVSGTDSEGLGVPIDVLNGGGSEISRADKILVEEEEKWDTFQAAQVSRGFSLGDGIKERSPIIERPTEVALVYEVSDLGFDKLEGELCPSLEPESEPEPYTVYHSSIEDGQNLDDNYTNLVFNNGSHDQINSSTSCENDDVSSTPIAARESIGVGIASSPGSDEGGKVEEDLSSAVVETHGLDNVIPESKEGEVSVSGSDATELVEDINLQWESRRDGKRIGNKARLLMKPLELAEELEKKHSFTGLHWEEGAAAQPMRLEGVRRGSTVLGYFDVDANNTITRSISSQAFRRDHGSPQVVAVHLNFIALGMSKGVIVVVPSKYSPHYADNMDAKMLMLGLQGDKSYAPVTSMCFNQQGELLFAGYHDGHYTVWDVKRASAVKDIYEHKAPVVHMLYLGQDSQVSRQFNVVSGDSKGVVKLIKFSVVPWLNRFSTSKPMTLLDESTSTVVCASQLLPEEVSGSSPMPSQGTATGSTSGIGSMMGGVVGGDWKLFEGSSLAEEGVVIFVTHQTALVAKVNPNVEVYAQLPKPDGVREGSMPYTAWKYTAQSHETVPVKAPDKVPLLAIAWDRKVQVAKLVKSELKIYGKWTLESSAIGVAWLDDEMLVVLTLTGQLCLFAKDGTVIHQTSFIVDGSRGDDLITYHTHFTNIFGNPEKAYHNCVAVRGATIYILGPMHLVVSRLLPWKERIEVLRKAGDWMGALNMAMTLYDGQAHGVIDLPRCLDDVQKAVMPYLVELLLSYVDEVFSYISVAFCNQIGKLDHDDDSKSINSSAHLEKKEQYTRVGGVAVEFCVHIKRTDILFDEILSRFVSVQHRETFLELLEPYILKDMLGSLPPEIMQALVEHYSVKGWLQRVEQCVLHMDISSLDFNQVVRLCREHRLYGALIYLFNKGLDDFKAPLEDLLVVLRTSEKENAPILGYRMLVYLKYCFSGLAFPPGHGTLPPTRLPSLRIELIQFLLEESDAPNSWAVTSLSPTGAYPNLYHLLQLDTEATLDVLRCAFVEDEIPKSDHPLHDSSNSSMEDMKGSDSLAENPNLVQKIVDVLCLILDTGKFQIDKSTDSDDVRLKDTWPSKDDIGHVFEFIAYYVASERSNVSKDVLSQILEYLTSDINFPPSVSWQNNESLKRREKQVLALLEVVPEADWDASYLLHLCEGAQFYQVCGLIHSIRHYHLAALESYMKDVEEPVHAFSFIDYYLRLSGSESDAFKLSIISIIPDLVKLSRECTFFLMVDHFSQESQHILSELHAHPESLFLYLKTIIEVHSTGSLNFSCLKEGKAVDFPSDRRARAQSDRVESYLERISDFPKFLRNNPVHVTDEMIELYLELLCRYEHNSVLNFLETFENYRVEHCLRLCQEYGIIDAAAFLLERVGDVGSALLLTLTGLNDKFIMLDAAVESVVSDPKADHFNTILKKKEVHDILDIVRACIQLCQRNSPRLDPDESESLWFQLLDSFCVPLMDSLDGKLDSEGEKHLGLLAESLDTQEDERTYKISWKVSKSHKGANVLRKLFSMFIKEIVEGMIGYLRLPTIMLKLLSDNGSQEFGDFKLTILGMLGTYDFERRILDTAKSLIEDDTFYTMSLLKKGASHGYGGPRSLQCCICNCLLSKNSTSSTSSIRVFNCGHATHLHCELQEKESSSHRGSSSAGCPICMPKKKAPRCKSKSVLAENGLLSKSSSKRHVSQGNVSLHPYESDAFENSYGSHPISRFEILTNLQKDQRMSQIENIPQLRLAPPAVYHEKVKKGIGMVRRGPASTDIIIVDMYTHTIKNTENNVLLRQLLSADE
ncbi:hypothetical protein LguiB_023823 [Lonicera macranthoides]